MPLSRAARSHQPATCGQDRPGRAISQPIIKSPTPKTIRGMIMKNLPQFPEPANLRLSVPLCALPLTRHQEESWRHAGNAAKLIVMLDLFAAINGPSGTARGG